MRSKVLPRNNLEFEYCTVQRFGLLLLGHNDRCDGCHRYALGGLFLIITLADVTPQRQACDCLVATPPDISYRFSII